MTTLDILPEVTCPPTDLWSDEPPLESDLHLRWPGYRSDRDQPQRGHVLERRGLAAHALPAKDRFTGCQGLARAGRP